MFIKSVSFARESSKCNQPIYGDIFDTHLSQLNTYHLFSHLLTRITPRIPGYMRATYPWNILAKHQYLGAFMPPCGWLVQAVEQIARLRWLETQWCLCNHAAKVHYLHYRKMIALAYHIIQAGHISQRTRFVGEIFFIWLAHKTRTLLIQHIL